MTTAEEAVLERLAADATVAGYVGTRVYQLRLPQLPTLPAIRVQAISVGDFFHLRGGSQTERHRVQVDVYAAESSGSDPYASAALVADAVHQALNGAVFEVGGSPVDLKVTGAMRADRRPLYESGELRLVRILQDYIVWTKRLT